jgi:flagellar M-ring protein FliF
VFELIKKIWSEFTAVKKIVFVTLLTVLFGLLVYSLLWITRDDYQVLFSDLNPQDASSMVSELEHLKTPYRLTDNGTTILVDKDSVYKTRLKLIGKGLNLNGSVGFELFNNTEFGMTEFAQKVNYLRALQGELERTIAGFDEIKSARVHLVLPESGLFKKKSAKPKASVSITMKSGLELTQEQISGIQKLVSASVPEVMRSEVTIVDHNGVALTKNLLGDDEVSGLYGRLDIKKQLESYLATKITSVLDRVVGVNKSIVSVDVNLSYDQVKTTKEDVIPLPNTHGQSVGAISKKRTTSQSDEMLIQEGDSFDSLSGGRSTPSTSATSEIEFVNNKRIEQILSSPGVVSKLSVGVIIPNLNDPVKLEKLKEVIAMAAGVNQARGDGLVVHDIEIFDKSENKQNSLNEKNIRVDDVVENHQTKSVANKRYEGKEYYFAVVLFVLLVMLTVFLISKRNQPKLLSATEKETLLNEINAWVKKGA